MCYIGPVPEQRIHENPKGIRGIDMVLWRRFKEYAWNVKTPVGELLNGMIEKFLKSKGL